MTLKEFREHRELFEGRLIKHLTRELEKFQYDAGVAVTDVKVILQHSDKSRPAGDPAPWPSMVGDVKVTCKI